MGYDMFYQALPANNSLLDLVKDDPDDAKLLLGSIDNIAKQYLTDIIRPPYIWHPEFIEELKKVVDENPGIETRHFDLYREFDIMDYLLSEQRRSTGLKERDDIVSKLIWGGESIHPNINAPGQGEFIRYVTVVDVQVAAEYLKQISLESLWDAFDPNEMYKARVYKAWEAEKTRENFDLMGMDEYLPGLQNFYAEAAQHNEMVIVRCIG